MGAGLFPALHGLTASSLGGTSPPSLENLHLFSIEDTSLGVCFEKRNQRNTAIFVWYPVLVFWRNPRRLQVSANRCYVANGRAASRGARSPSCAFLKGLLQAMLIRIRVQELLRSLQATRMDVDG